MKRLPNTRGTHLVFGLALLVASPCGAEPLLPQGWDPRAAGQQVLERLVKVTAPQVKRQSLTWFRDLDISSLKFEPTIHKAKLKTTAGIFDMEPRHFHADAKAHGFSKPACDYGLYLFDSFKVFDGRTYVALNNWPGQQNALALVHDDRATFEVLGHYNEPQFARMSESAVNRLPDGSWMAICRNDAGNYLFTTSRDGRSWTEGREMPFVPNGASSKPTFNKFGGRYYLGWHEATQIDGVFRSVFNVDVSCDGRAWVRKYRFETTKSFQYPTFHEHQGAIWLSVTQGDSDPSRKERIMFGKLEALDTDVRVSSSNEPPVTQDRRLPSGSIDSPSTLNLRIEVVIAQAGST